MSDQLKNFFQTQENPLADLKKLLNNVGAQSKKGFLVFKNNKYVTIQTEYIAFFYIRNDATTIVTFDRQEYTIDLSLEEVHQLLAAKQFFRINRQYLINFNSVKEVEHYFSRKLFVRLVIDTPEKLLVGKDKAAGFLAWLDNG